LGQAWNTVRGGTRLWGQVLGGAAPAARTRALPHLCRAPQPRGDVAGQSPSDRRRQDARCARSAAGCGGSGRSGGGSCGRRRWRGCRRPLRLQRPRARARPRRRWCGRSAGRRQRAGRRRARRGRRRRRRGHLGAPEDTSANRPLVLVAAVHHEKAKLQPAPRPAAGTQRVRVASGAAAAPARPRTRRGRGGRGRGAAARQRREQRRGRGGGGREGRAGGGRGRLGARDLAGPAPVVLGSRSLGRCTFARRAPRFNKAALVEDARARAAGASIDPGQGIGAPTQPNRAAVAPAAPAAAPVRPGCRGSRRRRRWGAAPRGQAPHPRRGRPLLPLCLRRRKSGRRAGGSGAQGHAATRLWAVKPPPRPPPLPPSRRAAAAGAARDQGDRNALAPLTGVGQPPGGGRGRERTPGVLSACTDPDCAGQRMVCRAGQAPGQRKCGAGWAPTKRGL
jgi:hypothetical protein